MNVRKEVCKALFVLHQIKNGPSTLSLKRKRVLMTEVGELETRALKFLAGYADWEDPREILSVLAEAVAVVSESIPKKHHKRGNPGKTHAPRGDLWVVRQHKVTGRKIPELVRDAAKSGKLDSDVPDERHIRRIRRLVPKVA